MKVTFVGRLCRTLLYGSLFCCLTTLVVAQGDGIFAEFNTSMGSFTCRVEYAKAPKASANFIGLATGQRAWLDLPSGGVMTTPFYDGQIFHRVIAGFMNQGGSPNGQGTDGPGYTFLDEFDPTLRHDRFGILSSANSGPDSNGSQFFVTVGPTPWLDDVHTVFGEVVGGSNVVHAINSVATDAGDRPLVDVVLNSVIIRRVGAAAQAFDIHAQGLPSVNGLQVSLVNNITNLSLSFSNSLSKDNRFYNSTNLVTWAGSKLGIETTAQPLLGGLLLNTLLPQRFYRMAQIGYAETLHVPKNVANKTITLNFSSLFGTIAILPDGAGGGIYSQNGGPIGLMSYTWIQDAYRGRLSPIVFGGSLPMKLHLDYDSATNGAFKGTAFLSATNTPPVSGTFTASP